MRAGLAQIWLRHVDIVGAVTCSYVGLKCLRRSLRCRWRRTGLARVWARRWPNLRARLGAIQIELCV